MTVRHHELDETCDGRRVAMFTLENANRVTARIMSYGGTLVSLSVPDRDGRFADVVLGFDDLAGYRSGKGYLGAIVGRYANRIAGARFALDGVEHRLTANEGPNHLHGGGKGFDKVVWEGVGRSTPAGPALELHYDSAHGEEGYPGNLSVRVVYTLTHDNALAITYSATTDRDTVVNLTHHAYWNLAGHDAGTILDHRLVLHAERFAPIGAGAIPTGELLPVDSTPFDFRRAVEIGARIESGDEQLRLGAGYDHSFAIDGAGGDLRSAARVVEPATGRVLEVSTTEPALQLYSGNWLDVPRGKAGATYRRRSGFCLETQHFPDSPNRPRFPPVILKKGAQYQSATIYRFLVDDGNVRPHGDLR
jgi:aldose 1-epimerase